MYISYVSGFVWGVVVVSVGYMAPVAAPVYAAPPLATVMNPTPGYYPSAAPTAAPSNLFTQTQNTIEQLL